ncbi:hypothetical protein [Absidia glauca]|uniref:Phosphatidate cytidylyltransferase, mitochondrial n=1 Tax=Absidia glauca TaxID=4829 RepID=A0A168NHU4_ABSGL|nr:hypothetical protein [Absidia glauca]
MLKLIPQTIRHTSKLSPRNHVGYLASYSTVQDTHTSHSSSMPPPPPLGQQHQAPPSTVKQDQLFNDETRIHLERLRQHHFHATNLPDSPDFGTNQYLNINEELRQQLKDIVAQFNAPIRYAFAYGSGVFRQNGYDEKKKPMMDFIFGVSHPGHWHALNMQQNPHHYSGLRMLGSNTVSKLQDNVGAGVYFNPYVEINGIVIKYGVVSIDKLCRDLIDWETLYVAGRMHKPVKILRDDARVRLANQVNLTEAVRVALLTLPEKFNEEQLFEKIAGISYVGDFRMTVGENPNKQNLNPRFRGLMVQKLPRTLYDQVLHQHRTHASRNKLHLPLNKSEMYQQIAASSDLPRYMDQCKSKSRMREGFLLIESFCMKLALRSIIAKPALTQSIKGIFTAGLMKSTRYAGAKLGKWVKSS